MLIHAAQKRLFRLLVSNHSVSSYPSQCATCIMCKDISMKTYPENLNKMVCG